MSKVDQLSEYLDETQSTLERERDWARFYQKERKQIEDELKSRKDDMDLNAFVAVLIDGDGMNVSIPNARRTRCPPRRHTTMHKLT